MRALILAAGYGTRLGNLTKNMPKPALKIGDKSSIERIVERLTQHGITDILVNAHYLPHKLVQTLKGSVTYYYEEELLGHNGTIMNLYPKLKDSRFFVINGDTISNVNYTEMNLIHQDGTITALMDEWRCAGTWLYDGSIYDGLPLVKPYRPHNLEWHDIGTPKRLKAAKRRYAS